MNALLLWAGRIAGALGSAAIAAAFASRLGGGYWLAGIQVGTVLQAGMAVTLVGCLAYLAALAEK